MYNGIEKMEEIIEYIESHLTSEIDYEQLASRMTLSVYEFRRIFAFIVGCPLSEYLRKRRLSLAACELITDSRISIRQVSEKYGYSTSASFSKAFSEYHGFSPTVCQREVPALSLFQRPKFEWTVQSTEPITFQIINDVDFCIKGYRAYSDYTDTCCCEQVWDDFYRLKKDEELSGERIYVSYRNEHGTVNCHIGERIPVTRACASADPIPECQWLTVKMNTTDDETVNKKYHDVLCNVLPSARLRRRTDLPTVEVFPRDMSSDHFEWEIRIPVEKERK